MKSTFRIAVFVGAIICAMLSAQLIAGPEEGKKPGEKTKKKSARKPYQPVLAIEQTMGGQRKLMKEIKDGILDGAWEQAEKSALLLAEISNTNRYHNKAKDYRGWAKKLSDDALALAKALKKRDEVESKKLLRQAGQNCSACHDVYKK